MAVNTWYRLSLSYVITDSTHYRADAYINGVAECSATAGTLVILIPPSITLVVYAVAADASIIRIFLAGFAPGLLLMALFSGYIAWWSWRHPDKVPPADPPTTLMEKIRLSGNLIPGGALIVFICWVLIAG